MSQIFTDEHRFLFCLLLSFWLPTFTIAQKTGSFKNNSPHGFIENKGQIVDQNYNPNPDVLYLLNTPGMNVQLRRGGFSYDLYTNDASICQLLGTRDSLLVKKMTRNEKRETSYHFHRIDFNLIGCNPDCEIVTSEPSADYLNYYTAGTPVKGVTFVRFYQSVTYKNIHPNVDLEMLVDEEVGFKYNFVIHPGGRLEDIRISISGADVESTIDGSLLLNTGIGVIEEKIPKSHLLKNGMKEDVNIRFQHRESNLYGFCLPGKESPSSTLVIDPVPRRLWSTYYGGEINESPGGCALDASGNLAIAGNTNSLTNIATAGAYQSTLLGNEDTFLARFTADGQREWGTYYGGTDEESNYACCTDHSGKIYISGRTISSTNISTPGSHQPMKGGWHYDCYLAKFSETGERIWATYYGGSSTDQQGFCCTDDSLHVYLTGMTLSINNISTSGSHQPALCGIQTDAFLAKFDSNGVRLWGTYYGGDEMDQGYACAASPGFNVYLTGDTHSQNNISTPGSHQPSYGGGSYDVFLAYFTPDGQRLWGTYYGGTSWDIYPSCAAAFDGSVYLGGVTNSQENISTAGSYQLLFAGAQDAFLARFSSSGNREWGTYYGGTDQDQQKFIAVDTSNNVYIVGNTNSSTSIASGNAFQDSLRGSDDAFLAKFDPVGGLLWGTYYGDTAYDAGQSVAIGFCGHQFLHGWTESLNNIATPGSFQPVFAGGNRDNFIVKFADCTPPDTAGSIHGPESICQNSDSIRYVVTFIPFATGYQWTVPFGTIIISGQNTDTIYVNFSDSATSGNVSVYGFNCCENGAPDSVQINVYPRPNPYIMGNDTACSGSISVYTTEGENSMYLWNLSPGNSIMTGGLVTDSSITAIWNLTGAQWISVNYTDTNGCEALTPAQLNVWVEAGETVEINIVATDDSVCAGTPVTFTASSLNTGANPLFQWFINGVDTNYSDSVLTYIPVHTDTVYSVVTSFEPCRSNNPDTSNTLIIHFLPELPVSVTIAPSVNPSCEDDSVSFTATQTNGGNSPTYQWQVNGITVGTNSPIFSYVPSANDQVLCTLTSSEPCTSGNPVSSYPVIVTVIEAPEVSFSACFDTITTTNAKPVRLKGGIPLGGIYSGTGVSNGYFYPAVAGPGNHLITYTYTNSALCTASRYSFLVARLASPFNCGENFLDVRDSNVYSSIQIGSQCWFSENLIYGNEIPFATSQRDNCIPEKYLQPPPGLPQPGEGSVYQWSELMTYTYSEEAQGLCPPGWHIPSEADWNQLFAFYQNNAFAGAPLKYTGYSGFNAFLNGAVFFNRDWYLEDFATFFWSSTSHGSYKAWAHGMNEYNYSVSHYPAFRANAFSVRCLRD